MAFGDRFLAHPDLFPARQSGEPWGDSDIIIDFAGGPYRFSGLSRAQRDALHERFGSLCGECAREAPIAVETRVFRVQEEEFRHVGSARKRASPRVYTIDMDQGPDAVRLVNHQFLGRLDWRGNLKAALWTADDSALVSNHGFENFFRVLVAHRLVVCGGVLLHSAGVVTNDGAYVFAGQSGAGKSTISTLALATGYTVLSDDLNALTVHEGRVLVERLPFAGELGRSIAPTPGRYALKGIFRLKQSASNAIEHVSPAHAFALLFANAPFVNTNSFWEGALGDNLSDILNRVPAKLLHFDLTGGCWNLLEH